MFKNKPSDKVGQFFQNDFIKICKGGGNLPPPFFLKVIRCTEKSYNSNILLIFINFFISTLIKYYSLIINYNIMEPEKLAIFKGQEVRRVIYNEDELIG